MREPLSWGETGRGEPLEVVAALGHQGHGELGYQGRGELGVPGARGARVAQRLSVGAGGTRGAGYQGHGELSRSETKCWSWGVPGARGASSVAQRLSVGAGGTRGTGYQGHGGTRVWSASLLVTL